MKETRGRRRRQGSRCGMKRKGERREGNRDSRVQISPELIKRKEKKKKMQTEIKLCLH